MPGYALRMMSVMLLGMLWSWSAVFAAEDAGEGSGAAPLVPVMSESESAPADESDEQAELPLEPAEVSQRGFKYGAVLEYWLLEPGADFGGVPGDPALTGMIDDSKQYFSGAVMAKDAELKNYASRQGLLQWSTNFRARRPGKHVFLLAPNGAGLPGAERSGAALAVNGEIVAVCKGDREASAVVDFSGPGLYKLQICLWWTDEMKANFPDMGVNLKVREPDALSLRQIGKKDLFYKYP